MRNTARGLVRGSLRLAWTMVNACQWVLTGILVLLGAAAFLSLAYGCCSVLAMHP